MRSMLRNDPSQLQQLTSQPWFQDGLTDEEAALIVVLRSTVHQEDVFRSLIERGKVISDTFSLPLTSEIDSYVVSRFPFQGDVLGYIRTGMGVIEDFMGSPWTPNMIALVEPEWEDPLGRGVAGLYQGTHFVGKNSTPYLIYHEMGHHYFSGMPAWLNEGGANFLAAYVLYTSDDDLRFSPEYRQLDLQIGAIASCANSGASNIQEWDSCSKREKNPIKVGAWTSCVVPLFSR